MYINYQLLYEKGLSDDDFHLLQKIFQKFPIGDADVQKFEEMGLVTYLKTGEIRISKKGNAFLSDLQILNYNDDIKEIIEKTIEMYTNHDKPIGNKLEIKNRVTWFVSQTNFSNRVILESVNDYLNNNDYILRLDNLFWKPQSHLSVHKNLKDSKIFDLIAHKYKLNQDYFLETKNKEIRWLAAVSRLEVPKGSIYFIGYKEDKIRIEKFKETYEKMIKK